MSSGIIQTLTPYVTSNFQRHGLTSTTSIIAGLASGLFTLPFAKILDIYGRAQGLALMVVLETTGLVMMAACKNVEMYCAAQVFYTAGYQGVSFTMTIFIADTCSLKYRALVIGLTATPTLAMVWAAGPAAQQILETIGVAWGFGIWCIIVPVVCVPWFFLLLRAQLKAKKQIAISSTPSKLRSPIQSLLYLLKEADALGLLILATGLSLFLLAFNLYTFQHHQWDSGLVISFIVIGALLILFFPVYERFISPQTFIPWSLLKNRTLLLVYASDFLYYMSSQTWGSFYYSVLIVIFNQSITHATYIANTYFVASTIWVIVMGIALTRYGKLKYYALYFGIPMTLLATGLQIKFRTSSSSIGYVVMCQILIAAGGGTMYLVNQLTIMAASGPENFTTTFAILGIVIQTGRAIGGTIGTALWTNFFPKKLSQYLPPSALPFVQQIYGSIYVQTSYPVGSPERDAINHAYGDTLRIMLIVATCLIPPCWIFIAFWFNYDVKNIKQKGMGFLL